jgi:hypothetical protein
MTLSETGRISCPLVSPRDGRDHLLETAELTTEQQRYEQIAEYTRLAKEKREADKVAHGGPLKEPGHGRAGPRVETAKRPAISAYLASKSSALRDTLLFLPK